MTVYNARPDTIFEINFFNTDEGQSWTNLSNYIEFNQGVNISRRRQLIFDEVSAGTFGVYLDNSAGTFNNDRTDLPYAGLIDIDTPIRYRIRWPRCPADTVNMLAIEESTANSTDTFNAEQGSLDLEITDVPAGQTTAIMWSTGVLQTTGIHCVTGDFSNQSADEYPVYVSPSTVYTLSTKVKCDTAGTGISFRVTARILWYDNKGVLISESAGTSTLLTTSYQTLSVTATSPAGAYSARVGIANETIVNPATAAIAITGYTTDKVNKGGKQSYIRIPPEANVGDIALAWHYCNSQPTYNLPAGWTLLNTTNDSRGRMQIAWKVLTQKDINARVLWTINQTGKHWLAALATYSGVDTAAPVNAHAESAESTYQTGHTSPTVTTTVANCWIVNGIFDTSTTNSNWAVPGTVTGRAEVFTVGGNAATGVIADTAAPVALGVRTGVAYAANAASKFASMSSIALKPATGTGPGNVTVWLGALQLEKGSSASSWASGGTWLDLYTGYVDSWSKTFAGDLSLMHLASTDLSKRLSSVKVSSAIYETIFRAVPNAYYQLDESGDTSTTQGANTAPIQQGSMKVLQVGTGGEMQWGQGTGPPVDATAAVKIIKKDINNGPVLRATLTNPIEKAAEISLMAWFASSDTDASSTLTVAKITPTNAGGAELAYGELRGTVGVNFQANGSVKSGNLSSIATATDATNYFDGKTHLAVATFQLTGGTLVSTLYMDGVQTATNSVAATFSEFPTLTTLMVANAYPTKHLCSGTFSHVAAVDYALDPDTIADIYTAGTTAFAGDTVDQRISRICDWAGITQTDLDASEVICDRHPPESQSVMSAIQQAAGSDGGTSFIDGSGNVVFKSRVGKEVTATPWMNIDVRYIQPTLNEVIDDQLLVNQATTTQLSTGAKAISFNLASQLEHGIAEREKSSVAQDIQQAQNESDYLTAFYAEPKQRCDNVVVEAMFLQDWPHIITQDMWNIIHIQGMPSIEQSSTLDLYVEGWEHAIDDQIWTITYDTSSSIPFAILNDTVRDITGTVVVAW